MSMIKVRSKGGENLQDLDLVAADACDLVQGVLDAVGEPDWYYRAAVVMVRFSRCEGCGKVHETDFSLAYSEIHDLYLGTQLQGVGTAMIAQCGSEDEVKH